MRTCGNCGSGLGDDALFCSRCGTAIPAEPPEAAEPPPPADPHPVDPPPAEPPPAEPPPAEPPHPLPASVVVDPPTTPVPTWPVWDDTEPAPTSYPVTEPARPVTPPVADAPGPPVYAGPSVPPPPPPPPPLPALRADGPPPVPPGVGVSLPGPYGTAEPAAPSAPARPYGGPAPVSHDPYLEDATAAYRIGAPAPAPMHEPPYAPVGPPVTDVPPPPGLAVGAPPGAPAAVDRPKRRRGLIALAVVLVVALVAAGIVLVTRDDDGDGGGRPSGELAWGANLGDAPVSFIDATGDGPVVATADGTDDANPIVVGLAAGDGAERWRFEADDDTGGFFLGRADGVVVVTASEESVAGIDEASGETRWTADARADLLSLVAGGYLVVAEDELVRALAIEDGSETWTTDVRAGGAQILTSDDDTVLVADSDGVVSALSLSDGRERWRYDSGGPSIEAQVVGSDVYVAAGDDTGERGQVARVALDSGEARWEERVTGDPFFGGADGDRVVFFWDDPETGAVVAGGYDVASGDREWRKEIGQDQSATVVAVEARRAIVLEPGRVTALEVATGDQAWRRSAGSDDEIPLAGVRGGVVYVADDERVVDGYAVESGEQTLHFEGSARINDLDVRGGRVFTASDDGAVYGLR